MTAHMKGMLAMNILIKNIKMLINGGTPKGDICISGNKILSAGVIPEGFAADKVIDLSLIHISEPTRPY